MRTILLPGTDITTSVLGMGCASLGSRIAAGRGRKMLELALAHGVTWFDIAPPYGAGRAEEILAPFLATHRHEVFVCSKVGLAPPRHNGVVRLAYGLGRPVLGMAHGLRRRFRAVAATRNTRVPLSPDLIETSLAASLARLGIDHLDVFALHDPDPADLGRDDVLRTFEKVRERGQARYLSVAGSAEAARRAAALPSFGFVQIADDPVERPLARLRAASDRPLATITHSVLGVAGAHDRLAMFLAASPALRAGLAAAGYQDVPEKLAADLLMRRAFASNSSGIVLASMFSKSHIADNAALAALPPDTEAARRVEAIFAANPHRAAPAMPERPALEGQS